jgi:hypothetical protein
VTDPNRRPCPVCDHTAVNEEAHTFGSLGQVTAYTCSHCGVVRCPRCSERVVAAWDEPAVLECAGETGCGWTGLAGRGADGGA